MQNGRDKDVYITYILDKEYKDICLRPKFATPTNRSVYIEGAFYGNSKGPLLVISKGNGSREVITTVDFV